LAARRWATCRLYGYEVSTERALRTLRAVLAGPINFLDTSNNYGDGESERRIGVALREAGGLPDGFVLATKVDRDASGDFSGARVRRSLQESLERLGLERLALVYLHDPEHIAFEDGVAPGGPVQALVELQREGLIDHLGVAGGPIDLMRRYIQTGAFEVVITHNRFTLVDRSAEPPARRGAGARRRHRQCSPLRRRGTGQGAGGRARLRLWPGAPRRDGADRGDGCGLRTPPSRLRGGPDCSSRGCISRPTPSRQPERCCETRATGPPRRTRPRKIAGAPTAAGSLPSVMQFAPRSAADEPRTTTRTAASRGGFDRPAP
jgi:hypothetical protein